MLLHLYHHETSGDPGTALAAFPRAAVRTPAGSWRPPYRNAIPTPDRYQLAAAGRPENRGPRHPGGTTHHPDGQDRPVGTPWSATMPFTGCQVSLARKDCSVALTDSPARNSQWHVRRSCVRRVLRASPSMQVPSVVGASLLRSLQRRCAAHHPRTTPRSTPSNRLNLRCPGRQRAVSMCRVELPVRAFHMTMGVALRRARQSEQQNGPTGITAARCRSGPVTTSAVALSSLSPWFSTEVMHTVIHSR